MALIYCPECQKEISNKVKACPHCGYPLISESNNDNAQRVEVTSISINSQKIKPIIGTVVLAIVILIVFFIYKNISKNTYIANLGKITEKMLDGAVIAEELTGLTSDVWYNTIHEDFSSKTDKYTRDKERGYGWNSFNKSLELLAKDPDIISKKSKLNNISKDVNELMELLNDPPRELQNSYNDLDKLYGAFTSFVNLAINPSGSLNSFTLKVNDHSSQFLESYNKLKMYIKK
jgi:hypothetical protein